MYLRKRDTENSRKFVTDLAFCLPKALRVEILGRALDAVVAIVDDRVRARILVDLAPHPPMSRFARMDALSAIRMEHNQVRVLTNLVPYLPEALLSQALDVARAIVDDRYRAEALTNMVPYLPETLREEILSQALDAATRVHEKDHDRVRILTDLIPYLPEALLSKVLDVALALEDKSDQVRVLANLVPYLPEALLSRVLDAAWASKSDYDRAWILASLAPYLPEALREEALGQVLDIAQAIIPNIFRDAVAAERPAGWHSYPVLPPAPPPPVRKVQFTTYYPEAVKPEQWYTLLAYVHVLGARNIVQADSRIRSEQKFEGIKRGAGRPTETIARGTEIVVVPEMSGCRFNPPKASILWLEDWHRIEFRMQVSKELTLLELDKATNGRLLFYVGPILIAEVKFQIHISYEADAINTSQSKTLYTNVFVSYSHKDSLIVELLEKAYSALGIKYLRDVRILRSGEKWNPALLRKIEEADIFQLCWSSAAKQSPHVEEEWRHALRLRRPSFVRPLYWENPMPAPPVELKDIHFAYLDVTT